MSLENSFYFVDNNKRKNTLLDKNDYDEPLLKKAKREIPTYELEGLIQNLSKVEGKDVVSRISNLAATLFEEIDISSLKKANQLWIETSKKVNIFVELTKDLFCSQAFCEDSFESSEGTTFHYLSMFEGDENNEIDPDNDLLTVRFSNKTHGELKWIQKGRSISGNEIADLYLLFEKAILKDLNYTMYLYDDATIDLAIGTKTKSLVVKRSRIWTVSWYEAKLGYSIATIKNCKTELLTLDGKVEISEVSQDAEAYKKALDEVRKMSLSTHYQFHKKYLIKAKKTIAICKRVFGNQFNIENTSRTLQDLQKGLSEVAHKNNKNTQLLKDQLFLTDTIFKHYATPNPGKIETAYLNNLYTIDNTRILSKSFFKKSITN